MLSSPQVVPYLFPVCMFKAYNSLPCTGSDPTRIGALSQHISRLPLSRNTEPPDVVPRMCGPSYTNPFCCNHRLVSRMPMFEVRQIGRVAAQVQADDLAQLGALVGGDGGFTHQFDLANLGDEPCFPISQCAVPRVKGHGGHSTVPFHQSVTGKSTWRLCNPCL